MREGAHEKPPGPAHAVAGLHSIWASALKTQSSLESLHWAVLDLELVNWSAGPRPGCWLPQSLLYCWCPSLSLTHLFCLPLWAWGRVPLPGVQVGLCLSWDGEPGLRSHTEPGTPPGGQGYPSRAETGWVFLDPGPLPRPPPPLCSQWARLSHRGAGPGPCTVWGPGVCIRADGGCPPPRLPAPPGQPSAAFSSAPSGLLSGFTVTRFHWNESGHVGPVP